MKELAQSGRTPGHGIGSLVRLSSLAVRQPRFPAVGRSGQKGADRMLISIRIGQGCMPLPGNPCLDGIDCPVHATAGNRGVCSQQTLKYANRTLSTNDLGIDQNGLSQMAKADRPANRDRHHPRS